MQISRRRVLKLSSIGALTAIAGCTEEASVEPEGNGSGNNEGSTFELGETAVFSEGDEGELSFTPTGASLHEALIYSSSNSIYSEVPETSANGYLIVDVEVENTGNTTIELPSEPTFILNNNQYEMVYTSAYTDSQYESYQELRTGAQSSGLLVYEIEPSDAEGRLTADFEIFSDSATAEWVIDVGGLDREVFDYSDLSTGKTVEIGTDDKRFSMAAISAEETHSYTYSSGSYEHETEANDGYKFIHVTVSAENTGESTVNVPGPYDISLVSESSQFESEYYSDSNAAYNGGEISPGVTREGVVQFEVPESVSSYQLQAALTSDLSAQWNL